MEPGPIFARLGFTRTMAAIRDRYGPDLHLIWITRGSRSVNQVSGHNPLILTNLTVYTWQQITSVIHFNCYADPNEYDVYDQSYSNLIKIIKKKAALKVTAANQNMQT